MYRFEQENTNRWMPEAILRRNRRPVLFVLSVLVILVVFWGLKLVGITQTHEPYCGDTTHSHVDACYSNAAADLEYAADWEASMKDVTLTGNIADDLVAIAQSQMEYTESTENFRVDADGVRHGITRYGSWYGNPYGDWSTMFVAFCLQYAQISETAAPISTGAETMRLAWEQDGLYQLAAGYTPAKGDILFLDENGNGAADHTAIVAATEDGAVRVIRGDYENAVCLVDYSLEDAAILGYGESKAVLWNLLEESFFTAEHIAFVENVLAELPSAHVVEAKLTAYEAAGNMAGYAEYLTDIGRRVKTAYVYWEDLGHRFRPLIGNYHKAEELNWTWMASTLANATVAANATVTVQQVNYYAEVVPTLTYGKTVGTATEDKMSFTYWAAVVVEENEHGLYVSKYITEEVPKVDYIADSENGFVLLLYNTPLNINPGDSVELGDWYKTSSGYSEGGFGTVTFGTTAQKKPAKTNAGLSTVLGVDTRNLVEVNLYNYGNNINDLYKASYDAIYAKYYAEGLKQFEGASDQKTQAENWATTKAKAAVQVMGFQNPGGNDPRYMSDLNKYRFGFGDNIVADNAAGRPSVTVGGGTTINATLDGATQPLSGIVSAVLGDYPALVNGTSLEYLFSDNKYATKLNQKSINGLFRYNAETGAYYFDCRDTHAQYVGNSADVPEDQKDTFTLYQQLLTSNFITYPFGNFLPLNDIRTQATKADTIDHTWFDRMATSALSKYNQGLGIAENSSTTACENEYNKLYQAMEKFIPLMDAVDPDWNYQTLMRTYFDYLLGKTYPLTNLTSIMSQLYTIDFDEPTDFYFGMDIHMDFMQPKGGLTGADGQTPMVYEFAGDDDVWVYIDNVLFLDLTGIHRQVGGKIDFEKGTVTYYAFGDEFGNISTEPLKTITFEDILKNAGKTDAEISALLNDAGTFKDYSEHTLAFYYLERGSGSGICSIQFNMPLLEKNRVTVTKELDVKDEDVKGDPDFYFQVLQEDKQTLFIAADAAYTLMDSAGNTVVDAAGKPIVYKTDANGIFKLKSGQTAVFGDIAEDRGKYCVRELLSPDIFEQYSSITVDGVEVPESSVFQDVTVGDVKYKATYSNIKDISAGDTTFIFTNHVSSEYGSLEISKILHEYADLDEVKSFAFLLNLGDVPIPENTPYQLIAADGTATAATITTAGQLILQPGQTARFEKILAGTKVWLKESDDSAEGYAVTYTGKHTALTEDATAGGVTGVVSDQTVGVTAIQVINDKAGTKLSITGSKTLLYPDGASHTYGFQLREIVSGTDLTAKEGGIKQTASISMVQGTESFEFVLNYPASTPVGTRYYQITEQNASAANGGDFTYYILAVEITAGEGQVNAVVSGLWKNGVADANRTSNIQFTNRVVRDLTISKTVENIGDTTTKFTFDLVILLDGSPIAGTYPCTGLDDVSELTFDAEGTAAVQLSGGQSITIQGLPYGATWTVTEAEAPGYTTQSAKNDEELQPGNRLSGALETHDTARFVNGAMTYVLPETGGVGAAELMRMGISLMALAAAGMLILRICRKVSA